jgi:hemolysin III
MASHPAPTPAAPAPAIAGGKPRLRGVSHQLAFFVAIAATVVLVVQSGTTPARWASFVFGTTLVLLFGISALYHRVDWTPPQRARMRQLDHAAIFVLIAGGYTPLFALVPDPGGGHRALWLVWLGAALGAGKSLAWPKAPKWILAALCVALGWVLIGDVMARTPIVGSTAVAFLVACGVIYSAGAAVYALKWPDPAPRIFGYHEVFHALVVVASGVLFTHVALVVAAVSR